MKTREERRVAHYVFEKHKNAFKRHYPSKEWMNAYSNQKGEAHMEERKETVGKISVGDQIRHVSGCHAYTVLEIRVVNGRYMAKVDPDNPNYMMDLADAVLVKKGE